MAFVHQQAGDVDTGVVDDAVMAFQIKSFIGRRAGIKAALSAWLPTGPSGPHTQACSPMNHEFFGFMGTPYFT